MKNSSSLVVALVVVVLVVVGLFVFPGKKAGTDPVQEQPQVAQPSIQESSQKVQGTWVSQENTQWERTFANGTCTDMMSNATVASLACRFLMGNEAKDLVPAPVADAVYLQIGDGKDNVTLVKELTADTLVLIGTNNQKEYVFKKK